MNNAFLRGHQSEEVYVEQSPGGVDPFLASLCPSSEMIPPPWSRASITSLVPAAQRFPAESLGFSCSSADSSLFTSGHPDRLVFLLVYMCRRYYSDWNTRHSSWRSLLTVSLPWRILGPCIFFYSFSLAWKQSEILLDCISLSPNISMISLLELPCSLDCKPLQMAHRISPTHLSIAAWLVVISAYLPSLDLTLHVQPIKSTNSCISHWRHIGSLLSGFYDIWKALSTMVYMFISIHLIFPPNSNRQLYVNILGKK